MSHSATPPRRQHAISERWFLLLLILLTFAIRVVALDRLGLAYDESASALMARATPQAIIDFHWHAAFEHPPIWVLMLHYWSLGVGQSEFALRLMPAFAGTLIVVMLWRITRTIWPRDPVLPLFSAIFAALAPVLIYYSQEARMYTWVVFLMLLAIHLVQHLRLRPSWQLIVGFWFSCWMMLGLHYYAALGLAIQAAVLGITGLLTLFRPRVAEPTFPWSKLFVAFAGALMPVIAWMIFSPGFHTTLGIVLDKAGENPVSWQYFLGDLWRELTFGSIRWQPEYASISYAIAPLVAIGVVVAHFQPKQNSHTRLGVWIITVVVLLPIITGAIALRTLVPRYILWVVPLFYALAALPASWLWRRHWLPAVALVAIVLGVDVVALQYYFGPYRKSDYRPMTEYLQSHGDPQREILLLEAPRQHLLAKYYVPSSWQVFPMPTLPVPDFWPLTAPLLVPEDEDDQIQKWLAEYDALWVSYSSEAEVDRGEFLAKYLTAVAYREQCTQWLDVRLCHYISPQHLMPTPIASASILYGKELALVAVRGTFYHLTPTTTSLLVQLDWHAQQKPTVDYKVLLRLLAPDGTVLDEANDFPIGSLLPPTTWNEGERKPGFVTLRVPSELPTGRYPVEIILYDANSLTPASHTVLSTSNRADTQSTDVPYTEPIILAVVQVDDTMQLSLIEQ